MKGIVVGVSDFVLVVVERQEAVGKKGGAIVEIYASADARQGL